MRMLLISPPVGNIGQAPPGISVLTAWMRSLGHECLQWDLGIEAFEYFHSRQYLEEAVSRIRLGNTAGGAVHAGAVVGRIEEAKSALRRPGIQSDIPGMTDALAVIRSAGSIIGAAHGICSLTYSRFDIPGAQASWRALASAVRDPRLNILLSYYREHVLEKLEDAAPDAVGISVSYHSQLLPAFTLAFAIKEALPELTVLLGGAFLKAVQDDLCNMPAWVVPADGICIGDGEPTLAAFAQCGGERVRLNDVPNLLVPRDGLFKSTGRFCELDLDEAPVPMMCMDGLDPESYLVPRYAFPLPITRGCHWRRCVFCNISNQARERYRARSAEFCVADMLFLNRSCGADWFDFPTDSVLHSDLRRLAEAILDRKLDVRWAAEVLFHPGLTKDLIALLAESGCCCLRFGLESACRRTLKVMDKRVDPEAAADILRACREHDVMTGVMVIVGFPTETQKELMETVEFLRSNNECIDFLTLHQFSVAPGSRLADQPDLAGIHLLPRHGVLTPSLPYGHSNPVAMRPDDLPGVVSSITEALCDVFPQVGQLWASGVGGWLTFAASCSNAPDFFKRKLPADNPPIGKV